MPRYAYTDVDIFKTKGGMSLDAWVAHGSARRTGIKIDEALRPKAKSVATHARANLAATRSGDEDYGQHSHIEVSKGRVDWYVTMSVTSGNAVEKRGANPALSVEYGRGAYYKLWNGRKVKVKGFGGLFILHRAVKSAGRRRKGL